MKLTKLFATSALTLLAVPAMAVELTMYGQVEKLMLMVDDGQNTDFNIVDSTIGGTLLGFTGEQKMDNGLTASFLLELPITGNTSNNVTQFNSAGSSTAATETADTLATDWARVGLSGNFGTVLLGRQDTAADARSGVDLGDAKELLTNEVLDMGGSLKFRNATTGGFSSLDVNDVIASFDEENLSNSIRYNSPEFYGLSGAISAAQGGDMEIGAGYETALSESFTLAAGLGYRANGDAAPTDTNIEDSVTKGSVSLRHSNGVAATLGYAQRNLVNTTSSAVKDPTNLYAKVSYGWDAYAIGADYSVTEDLNAGVAGSEGTSMGVAATWQLADGVWTGATVRQISYEDDTTTNYDDIMVMGLDFGVKF
ncbi:MAG: porin [Alphaproteobacteria bacterium]